MSDDLATNLMSTVLLICFSHLFYFTIKISQIHTF